MYKHLHIPTKALIALAAVFVVGAILAQSNESPAPRTKNPKEHGIVTGQERSQTRTIHEERETGSNKAHLDFGQINKNKSESRALREAVKAKDERRIRAIFAKHDWNVIRIVMLQDVNCFTVYVGGNGHPVTCCFEDGANIWETR